MPDLAKPYHLRLDRKLAREALDLVPYFQHLDESKIPSTNEVLRYACFLGLEYLKKQRDQK